TFTEAAAAEMKSRIHSALRDRAAAAPTDRLKRQAMMIEQAQVSTLHGFCARLLREHFHLAGLDPSFSVLDADEAKLLRLETARGLPALRRRCDAATQQIKRLGGFEKYLPLLDGMAQVLGYWDEALRTGGPDALAEVVQDLQLPRLPSIPNGVPGKEVAKAA